MKSLEKKELVMSWSGDYNNYENKITINGLFANKLGLSRKEQVLVTFVQNIDNNNIGNCDKCYLKPITQNDWQLLALNSSLIESELLNQIRVIVLGQIFPVWINSSNICLFVEVFQLEPKNFSAFVLNTFTEVIVSPHMKNIDFNSSHNNEELGNDFDNKMAQNLENNCEKIADETNANSSMISSMFGFVKSFLSNSNSIDEKNSISEQKPISGNEEKFDIDSIELSFSFSKEQVLRILPFDNELENNDKDIVNTVFISSNHFNDSNDKYFVSKLTNILSPYEKKRKKQKSEKKDETKSETNDTKTPSNLISEMDFKETLVLVCAHNRCPDSSVFICDNLRRQMGLSITSRIFLSESIHSSIPVIKELTLCPIGLSVKRNKITKELLIIDLIRLIEKISINMLFMTNGSIIHLCEIDFFAYHKSETSLFVVTKSSAKELSIEMSEPVMCSLKPFCEIPLPLSCVKDIDKKLSIDLNSRSLNKPFGGYNDLLMKCFNFLKFALNLGHLSTHINNFSAVKSNSLLIYGQKGSGKSHLLNALINKLTNFPHYVYVQCFDCSSLKGKRIESLKKSWNNSLAEALHRQPALLIFEDLDAIASMPSKPGQEVSAEAIYSERVSQLFVSLIDIIMKTDICYGNQIALIATSKSYKTLQSALIQTRGKHIFQEIVELSSPDLQQRIDILSQIISHKFNDSNIDSHLNLNLKEIALKSKGYLPIDLSALVERAVHNCFLSSQSSSLTNLILSEDNFRAAFEGFSPINLRGLDLQLKSNRRISDIGGLADVKKALLETLLWPIKYPLLFSKLPLKPQSSIMLFGAPGTGKTLVIEAIANECGINFIGIKGPELLSKYVGASEQSVRDLFSRAQSARPCILFFDEFDALAPRRGHDSTGVTDRVVNQLLTQMDGVEALQTGVYVLSASSRPDLVDPALLRPGRFDKCLYCPLPNQNERLEILHALSAKLSFSFDVDFQIIASLTHNFSGADLQALLYNAQLDALHNSIYHNYNQFKDQQINRLEVHCNQNLQSIAYMPSVEKGFTRNLNNVERQQIINEIEALKYNQIYLSNTQIDDNNSLDTLTRKQTSQQNLIAIEQKHLLAALEITKPSINEIERKRYDKM